MIFNGKTLTAAGTFTVDALPYAKGIYDGASYTAIGNNLPTVESGSYGTNAGKGSRIIFVPSDTNTVESPTLQLNDGEVIQIRIRAPRNQGSDDDIPDATFPVPIGSLMRGVPYTMTFCGKYWLVDSYIATVQAPTADDAGKVLMVNAAGNAEWTEVANSEEVAY